MIPAKRRRRPQPVACVWTGEHFIPLPRFKRLCDELFAIHEEYPLMIVENRSQASHNHYFAALHEGYMNLSEEYAQEFSSSEHMRKWCLCKEGFCTTTKYEMNTAADARILREILKGQEEAAMFIRIDESTVTVFTPESQSMAEMKKEKFEASKAAVLARVASMAQTTPAELSKNAGRSA